MICIEWSKNNTIDEIVTILHPIKNVTLWPLCTKFHHQEATGSKSGGHIICLHVYRPLYWCRHDAILWLNLQNTTLGIYYDSIQPAKSNLEPQSKCPSKMTSQSQGIDLLLSRSSKIRIFVWFWVKNWAKITVHVSLPLPTMAMKFSVLCEFPALTQHQGFWIYLYFRIRHSFAHV